MSAWKMQKFTKWLPKMQEKDAGNEDRGVSQESEALMAFGVGRLVSIAGFTPLLSDKVSRIVIEQ